jgi:hypothetical protein
MIEKSGRYSLPEEDEIAQPGNLLGSDPPVYLERL